MNIKPNSKSSYLLRFSMTVLTTVLIVLFLFIMSLVSKIQGTARIVNYAGLVRGGTQRIIKLENAGDPQDKLIAWISDIIDGLKNGSDSLNLVRLNDPDFQNKMTELDDYFERLKSEIFLVREKGWENTDIIAKSERFFGICDEATGLAEVYSQKMASSLNRLEHVVVGDIVLLLLLIGIELVKALRYAALNRILQKKVYLDEATGLPNKNKCEEILNDDRVITAPELVAVCSFDLNNLRTINNTMGHEKGNAYIRSFAVQLQSAIPEGQFAGRSGGDEFIAVLKGLEHDGVNAFLENIRNFCKEYSALHPEMLISYAAGYALSSDFDSCTLRDLFRLADKNMYIDKNQAKMEEVAREKKLNYRLLDSINDRGFHFSDCLYCDALLDQYRVLRASSAFFLADDGSYSGAVEQIVQELSPEGKKGALWKGLQLTALKAALSADHEKLEFPFEYMEGDRTKRGRLTLLFSDGTAMGELHHFILGFETFNSSLFSNEKEQLTQYYDQMRQSILENDNYVDALMDTAETIFTVNLTDDLLERIFYHAARKEFNLDMELPCSYNDYCRERSRFVASETLENYYLMDSSAKLLERFRSGTKQLVAEYQETSAGGTQEWIQKTILMSQDTRYDSETGQARTLVQGIVLFKNTTAFHETDEQEKERLQSAFEEADSASKAKTVFLNRMSHDVRTPINGIMGMLDIIENSRGDQAKMDDCLKKIRLSANHLLALVNDVLTMSRLDSEPDKLETVPFDLSELMSEVSSLVKAQLLENNITHEAHRENLVHTRLLSSPLHLRQIMLNLFTNAIKYNRPGGRIDTYAREVSCDGTTALYEFKIRDTGMGMNRDFIENQLFKPFCQENPGARTQYTGTGLGLSIVKDLIEQMKGSIEVESTPGKGTTFTFRLPFQLDTQNAAPESRKQDYGENPLSGIRVLLVEDNEINMEIAEFYLKERGAVTDKAWDGKEALEKFEASSQGFYDVILMDIMMPGMDGLEATRRIRALSRADAETVPILAMTAQFASDNADERKAAGMSGHLSKPMDPDKMAEVILQHSGKGSAHRSSD